MANTYDTSAFPLGSKDPRVLYNNAENEDLFMNDMVNESFVDRPPFRRNRYTLFGMEQRYDRDQAQRVEQFNQFLLNSGYEDIGDYDDGPLTLTARNQVFEKDGELWRASATLALPYTTINDWDADKGNFVSVGDAALRQEIAGLYTDTVSFWKYGGVGIGGDDTLAINACIAACKSNRNLRLVQNGGYWKYSDTIDLTQPGDFRVIGEEPRVWDFNCVMHYTGVDKAFDVRGNGFAHEVRVATLIGSGVGAIGEVGSTSERIGFHIGPNSGVHAVLGTVRAFNHNIMISGGYFNTVDFNYSFDCYSALTLRRHPTLNYRADGNIIRGNLAGGPFTDVNAEDFETRRLFTAVYGLYADGASDNKIKVGAFEYCVRTDTGRGVYLGADTVNNIVKGHVEGGITGLVDNLGQNNKVPAYNGNSVRMSGLAINDKGFYSEVGPLGSQGTSSQDTTFAPHGGQAGTSIGRHSRIIGPIRQQEQAAGVLSAYSIVSSDPGVDAFAPSSSTSSPIVVTRTMADMPPSVNWPASFGKYVFTSSTAATRWLTVGPHTVPTAATNMMMSFFVRGVTGDLKFSVFVLDQALALVPEAKINTQLTSSQTVWQEVKFPIKKLAGTTSLYYRIAIRDMSGGSGGVVEFTNPVISDDVSGILNATVISGTKDKVAISGNALVQPINQNYAMLYPDIPLAVVSAGLDIRGRQFVRVTGVASGTAINGFRSVTPGQIFEVFNRSGSALTVTTNAISGGASVTIADKASRRFYCDISDSLIYVLG